MPNIDNQITHYQGDGCSNEHGKLPNQKEQIILTKCPKCGKAYYVQEKDADIKTKCSYCENWVILIKNVSTIPQSDCEKPNQKEQCSFNHRELPNCDICEKLKCKHQKEPENWEKEFDKVFPLITEWQPSSNEPIYDLDVRRKDVKSFLRSQLSLAREEEREEIIERVDKYRGEMLLIRDEQLGRKNTMIAYDMDSRQVAAKQIIEFLKGQ